MDRYKVLPGSSISLKDWDPGDSGAYQGDKGDGKDRLDDLNVELETLQELLWAEHKHKILILLQGMDTSGKDGTIRHVFQGVDPQGVRVAGFKVPTPIELDHDYLWRVHSQVPRPRLLVAGSLAGSRQRRDRDLQPQPLRGCAGREGA